MHDEKRVLPSRVWWVYFAYMAISWLLYMRGIVEHGSSLPGLSLASSVVDTAALVGLYFFIRGARALVMGLWGLVFVLLVAQFVLVLFRTLHQLLAYGWLGYPSQRVSLMILLATILGLPLVYAIGRYAFFSPHIWRKASPDTA